MPRVQVPLLPKAVVAVLGHDDVVDHGDPHQLARAHHPLRQLHVVAAGRGIARRMIMEQDERRRAGRGCGAEDLARMDDARVHGTDREQRRPDHPVLRVEQQDAELLDGARAELRRRGSAPHRWRCTDLRPFAARPDERAPSGFDGRDQLRRARGADTGHAAQLVRRGPGQSVQAAHRGQHRVGQLERARFSTRRVRARPRAARCRRARRGPPARAFHAADRAAQGSSSLDMLSACGAC